MIGYPKPEALAKTKARKARQDAKNLRAFRQIVWGRERAKVWPGETAGSAACQSCGMFVFESREPRGEVHHRIGRRNKATRYDPDNGVLLCRDCHRAAQEHRITV